ncbi:iron-containing alcohol dehydrogenase [Streptomyces sp. CC0208]|uniref:iron-containing alcohol dehydrogenase n=2 Tax=Streptomyces TaxID=1883 RepID=UPI000E515104|nr:iron-containing alcohol dehydrogenase [Streptomyces sp. CC0208]
MTTALPPTQRSRPATAYVAFGPGAALGLPQILDRFGDERPALVLAGHGAGGRPWLAELRATLPRHVFITLPGGYPTWDKIDRIAALMNRLGTGPIVAVGGGSVLDTAKVAAVRAAETAGTPRRPVTAVPTTPGTGAEVTPFATVWDFTGNTKESFAGEVPDAVVVDPELTRTLRTEALGGMVFDTLAQGMEAAWSAGSTPEAVAHGTGAVALAAANLERLLADPDDMAARSAISLAGLYSGRAIAVARTTVCHALSYPMTLRHGIPHGHACGLTLGAVLAYNARTTDRDCRHPRGARGVRDIVARILDALRCDNPDAAAQRLEDLLAASGLAGYDAHDFDDERLAAEAMRYDRADNNPRRLDPGRLRALLAGLRQPSSPRSE